MENNILRIFVYISERRLIDVGSVIRLCGSTRDGRAACAGVFLSYRAEQPVALSCDVKLTMVKLVSANVRVSILSTKTDWFSL